MGKLPVGEQELGLLKACVEKGGATVGELQSVWGEPRGLARSTVMTMLERLRAKGYLTRKREGGVYRYEPRGGERVLSGLVGRFVDKALGGSLSPFVAYLSGREEISDGELRELERLVERLKKTRKER